MDRLRLNIIAPLAVLCSALAAPDSAADSLVDDARQRIDQGDAAGALERLMPLADARAGEAEFDYALALALLDAGRSLDATIVFERVLLAHPSFHGARIDLGRAYFNLGRYSEARRELEQAQAAGPPPQAQRVVSTYLRQIDRIERRQRYTRFASLGTRAGYDSNVNSATALDEFLGFGLNERSREQDSDFFEVGLGAGASYALTSRSRLSGRLNARLRQNPQASFADSDVIAGGVRLDRAGRRQRQSVALDAFTLVLDGERNSSAVALSADWRFELANVFSVGPTARFGRVRFQDSLAVKDVDQWSVGAAADWRFGGDGQGTVTTALSFGQDRPVLDSSRYARDVLLWNSALNWRFSDSLSSALAISLERGAFDSVFFEQAFTDPREDLAVRARGAIDWQFARRWRLQHALTWRRNDTDVSVFEFERFEASLGLRYVWN